MKNAKYAEHTTPTAIFFHCLSGFAFLLFGMVLLLPVAVLLMALFDINPG